MYIEDYALLGLSVAGLASLATGYNQIAIALVAIGGVFKALGPGKKPGPPPP